MNLDELLQEVTEVLDGLNLRWALIGGLALGAYGVGRPTSDVDLIVDFESQATILAEFETRGFETLHASSGYSNHLRDRDRVDLVYVRGDTASRIFESVQQVSQGDRNIHVVRPEHLAAMKVLAMKNDPSRLVSELADLEQLLRIPGVDKEAIRLQFERHGLEGYYHHLLERI